MSETSPRPGFGRPWGLLVRTLLVAGATVAGTSAAWLVDDGLAAASAIELPGGVELSPDVALSHGSGAEHGESEHADSGRGGAGHAGSDQGGSGRADSGTTGSARGASQRTDSQQDRSKQQTTQHGKPQRTGSGRAEPARSEAERPSRGDSESRDESGPAAFELHDVNPLGLVTTPLGHLKDHVPAHPGDADHSGHSGHSVPDGPDGSEQTHAAAPDRHQPLREMAEPLVKPVTQVLDGAGRALRPVGHVAHTMLPPGGPHASPSAPAVPVAPAPGFVAPPAPLPEPQAPPAPVLAPQSSDEHVTESSAARTDTRSASADRRDSQADAPDDGSAPQPSPPQRPGAPQPFTMPAPPGSLGGYTVDKMPTPNGIGWYDAGAPPADFRRVLPTPRVVDVLIGTSDPQPGTTPD